MVGKFLLAVIGFDLSLQSPAGGICPLANASCSIAMIGGFCEIAFWIRFGRLPDEQFLRLLNTVDIRIFAVMNKIPTLCLLISSVLTTISIIATQLQVPFVG